MFKIILNVFKTADEINQGLIIFIEEKTVLFLKKDMTGKLRRLDKFFDFDNWVIAEIRISSIFFDKEKNRRR